MQELEETAKSLLDAFGRMNDKTTQETLEASNGAQRITGELVPADVLIREEAKINHKELLLVECFKAACAYIYDLDNWGSVTAAADEIYKWVKEHE